LASFTDTKIYNNTLINRDRCLRIFNRYNTSCSGSEFKNNICWPGADHVVLTGTMPGMTWGPNQWSANVAPITAVRHTDDVLATPVFITPGRFENVIAELILISDVAFQQGSPGISEGGDVSAYITQLFAPTDTDARTASLSTVSEWDMGAVDYGGSVSTETNCTNSIDDDGDGFTDCDDSDCSGDVACTVVEENCTNGLDDDNDGAVDCADTGCYAESYCEQPESTCDDNIDNDGDGKIDCLSGLQDSDCGCAAPTVGNQPKILGGRSY